MAADKTDWDRYYSRPAPTASVTRRFTERRLLELIRKHGAARPLRVCELGGANSCFLAAMLRNLSIREYHIIDNNARGLSLLAERFREQPNVTWHEADILAGDNLTDTFDLAYSVGLIEHFDVAGTTRVIARHFDLVRPDGLVLITFPTPTWLYRAIRAVIESVGQWPFPDERPLTFGDVLPTVLAHGELLHQSINWPVMLTQGFVVARKHQTDPVCSVGAECAGEG